MIRILTGDVRDRLAELSDDSVHCVVTSPPYYGLRDYGTAQWYGGDPACDHQTDRSPRTERPAGGLTGSKAYVAAQEPTYRQTCGKCGATRIDNQIGLEPTLAEYIDTMTAVFREVRRVLRSDGVCFLNIGDSYAAGGSGGYSDKSTLAGFTNPNTKGRLMNQSPISRKPTDNLKPKDLMMVPARLALALQADGWWLRSDIIWAKPNPMPESVTDRPTSAHEHIFLLTKSARYFYDADAVRENHSREWWTETVGPKYMTAQDGRNDGGKREGNGNPAGRNLRNVWTIATQPFSGAHFATFPQELVRTCIKAGCPADGTVLDPFFGSGTTGLVADQLGRDCIGIELNPTYAAMAEQRIRNAAPLLAEVTA